MANVASAACLCFYPILRYAAEMVPLSLSEFHRNLSARFGVVNGQQVVDHYGEPTLEHAALRQGVALLDLSFRSRLCLTGNDRQRFLNGQVTNNVKDLQPGQGCYAAIVNHKGKVQGDLYIHALAGELLLDFEPGFMSTTLPRLEKFIIADDVQIVDVAPHYGLLSLQGPCAGTVLAELGRELQFTPPAQSLASCMVNHPVWGEVCIVNLPRTGSDGFDLFVPGQVLAVVATRLLAVASRAGGMMCGWQALETARIEAGLPRYDVDMDETNLAPEAGIEARAISYSKGCYTGQEVIARIRSYGQVAKSLRGLRLANDLAALPMKGDKLFLGDRTVGYVTSAVRSPSLQANLALGYVRKECQKPGTELVLVSGEQRSSAMLCPLPFRAQ
ncbi:MAG: glycine cleavage T C-terminal barrel domain-containing protein [Verrucomicrobiota bacterium]